MIRQSLVIVAVFFLLGVLVIQLLQGPGAGTPASCSPMPGMLQVPIFSQPGGKKVDLPVVNKEKLDKWMKAGISSVTGLDLQRFVDMFILSSGLFSTAEETDRAPALNYCEQEMFGSYWQVELD